MSACASCLEVNIRNIAFYGAALRLFGCCLRQKFFGIVHFIQCNSDKVQVLFDIGEADGKAHGVKNAAVSFIS